MPRKNDPELLFKDYFASGIASNFTHSFNHLLETLSEVYSFEALVLVVSHADKQLSKIQKLEDALHLLNSSPEQLLGTPVVSLAASVARSATHIDRGEEHEENRGIVNQTQVGGESAASNLCVYPSFLPDEGGADYVREKNHSSPAYEPKPPNSSPSSLTSSISCSPTREDTIPQKKIFSSHPNTSLLLSFPRTTSRFYRNSNGFFYISPFSLTMINNLPEKDEKKRFLLSCLTSELTTLLVAKNAVVCSLREMAEFYGELSHAFRYWKWRRHHRVQHYLHSGAFIRPIMKRLPSFFFSSSSSSAPSSSVSLSEHLFAIRSNLRIVVTLIGGLYSFFNRTTQFFDLMQERVRRGFLDPVTFLHELHQENKRFLAGVKSIFEESQDQLHYTNSQRSDSFAPAWETNFPLEEVSTADSNSLEDDDRLSLDELGRNLSLPGSALRLQRTISLKRQTTEKPLSSRLYFISVMKTASDFVEEMRAQSRKHFPPLLARQWRLIFLSSSLLATALTISICYTPEDVYRICRYSTHTVLQLVHLYGIVPAKSIAESVLYSRPGVDTRIAAFHKEAQAVAQTITDYHADFVRGMKKSDLHQLHQNIYDALLRGDVEEEGFRRIEGHYQNSVRHPLQGVLFGHLPRLLLIRMSIQSLEITRVVNGIDEVLESNRLNFQVMTIIPLLVVGCFCTGWFWWKWKRTMRPVHFLMRLCWRKAHRILNKEMISSSLHTQAKERSLQKSLAGNRSVLPYPPPTALDFVGRKLTLQSSTFVDPTEEFQEGKESYPLGANGVPGDEVPLPSALRAPSFYNKVGFNEEPTSTSYFSHLSDYEQGLLLLAVYEMRIAAKQFLRSYNLQEELLDDLEMVESSALSRHHRLEVLHRMRMTHKFL